MKIDKQFLFQHAARARQRIVSVGYDVMGVPDTIQRAIATVADELSRRSSPARELQPVAEPQAVRNAQPAPRRHMR